MPKTLKEQQSIVRQSCAMSAIHAINQFVEFREFVAEANSKIIIQIATMFYNWVFNGWKDGDSADIIIVKQSTLKVAIESIKTDPAIKTSKDIITKAEELLKWIS
jgi:hypothetical protein